MNRFTFAIFLLFGCLLMGAITYSIAQTAVVTYNHDRHVNYMGGMECTTCHGTTLEILSPPRSACVQCHGNAFSETVIIPALKTHGPAWALTHGAHAKSKRNDCMQCHDQPRTRNIPDCLSCHIADKADEMGKLGNNFSNIHTSEFSITHPIAARTNPNLCANCHRENRFCTDCHDKFRRNDLGMESHRRNFSALQTGPLAQSHDQFTEADCKTCHVNSIIPTHEWSTAHAREARKNLATCQACHPSGDTCVKCHSARSGLGISPHPKNWNKIKGRLERASGGATCSRCH